MVRSSGWIAIPYVSTTTDKLFLKCRQDRLGQSKKSDDAINRTAGLDNYGIVGLQRQIMQGLLHFVGAFAKT